MAATLLGRYNRRSRIGKANAAVLPDPAGKEPVIHPTQMLLYPCEKCQMKSLYIHKLKCMCERSSCT